MLDSDDFRGWPGNIFRVWEFVTLVFCISLIRDVLRLCCLRPNERWISDMGKKILLVDNDDALRDTLAEQLQLHNEFELTGVGTAEQGSTCSGRNISIAFF